MTILVLIGMVAVIMWEIFHGRISLNSVLLLLLMNFVSGFRLELMYMSLIVSIRSSLTHWFPYFSAACAAAIVHRNHFFRLHQQNKKVKFRQASNRCKRVLEAAKLNMLIKQKSPLLPRNFALGIFGELPIVLSTK